MQNTTQFKQLIHEAIEENQTIRELKTDVAQLKTDVRELKTDVAQLKTDVGQLKTDVGQLKTDMSEVKTDIAKLYDGQQYLGVMMEDMKNTLNLVLDAVIPARERAAMVDEVAAKVDGHEYRISALESVVKDRGL